MTVSQSELLEQDVPAGEHAFHGKVQKNNAGRNIALMTHVPGSPSLTSLPFTDGVPEFTLG